MFRDATVGTQAKNLKQKPQKNADYWLTHMPRGRVAHSGLDSPILIINQENVPQTCTQNNPIKVIPLAHSLRSFCTVSI